MSNDNSAVQKDINLDLPDLSVANVEVIGRNFLENLLNFTTDYNYWIPFLIVIFALLTGILVRRTVKPRLLSLIDGLNTSYRVNRILKNLTKLVSPAISLFLIVMALGVLNTAMPAIQTIILTATAKLLMAWIVIRTIAQIIENNFVRQIVAVCCWIIASISILGIMPQTVRALDAFGMDFGDFRLSLLTVVKIIIAFFILLTITRVLIGMAERSLQNTKDLTPSARVLLIKIIKVTLAALAVLIGVTMAGIDLSALAIFGGALGLGIGFGLQKVVSNLFSGMLLLVDKSIKPGDIIEMRDNSGVFGWVNQLGARYVSIITRDNKEYLIPNEDFVTQPVINWSYSDRKIRVETSFGVDYKSDPHLVKKIGTEVPLTVKRVVSDPKPVCHLVEFGDSSLNFVLRYWIEDAENGVTNTKGDVMLALWDAFQENGIEIPFPHRVLIQKP